MQISDMERQTRPIPAVRAIIQNEADEILVLKRCKESSFGGRWNLPGGKIDLMQTAEQAVIAEVFQETGLQVTSVEFLFYRDCILTESSTHYPTFYFSCKAEGTIKLNIESEEFAWVNKDNYKEYNLAFENDKAVEEFLLTVL